MKNLIVQRFAPGHQFYSDVKSSHDGHEYQATFGQILDADTKEVLAYTMERRDTLPPEGEYDYSYYNSPINHSLVPLLHNVPGFSFIEMHIANYPHEVKGCTAIGTLISVNVPMLLSSGKAFNKLMKHLAGDIGKVRYETLK